MTAGPAPPGPLPRRGRDRAQGWVAVHSSPTTSLRGRWRSDACGVRSDLAAVLREHGGVADLAQLGAVVPPRSVTRAIGRGEVVRLLPRSYVAGDVAGERV